jgi:hypothetical protein
MLKRIILTKKPYLTISEEKETQRDRETDRRTDRESERNRDRETDRKTDRETEELRDRQTGTQIKISGKSVLSILRIYVVHYLFKIALSNALSLVHAKRTTFKNNIFLTISEGREINFFVP